MQHDMQVTHVPTEPALPQPGISQTTHTCHTTGQHSHSRATQPSTTHHTPPHPAPTCLLQVQPRAHPALHPSLAAHRLHKGVQLREGAGALHGGGGGSAAPGRAWPGRAAAGGATCRGAGTGCWHWHWLAFMCGASRQRSSWLPCVDACCSCSSSSCAWCPWLHGPGMAQAPLWLPMHTQHVLTCSQLLQGGDALVLPRLRLMEHGEQQHVVEAGSAAGLPPVRCCLRGACCCTGSGRC